MPINLIIKAIASFFSTRVRLLLLRFFLRLRLLFPTFVINHYNKRNLQKVIKD